MKIFLLLATVAILQCVLSCHIESRQKFVDQPCKDDSDCYNGGNKDSVSCEKGHCKCSDGYLSQFQWFAPKDRRQICVSAPYQSQQCETECQKPFLCTNSTLDMKTCQCSPPYIDKNGICYLECKEDELFEYSECRKRCEHDENKGDKGVCKKIGHLGEKCTSKNECWAPYSLCIDGICTCDNGFEPTPKKDRCQSSQLWCPVGEPIRGRNHQVVECKVVEKHVSPAIPARFLLWPRPYGNQLEDNCGHDQFCMLTSGEGYYAEGAIGHCCPKPNLRCPIGNPHPNATCGQSISGRDMPKPDAPYCPYGSHSCIRYAFGAGYETSLCCLTICSSHQVLVGGICYPKRDHGDRCQVHEQCKLHNGICEKGRCTCGKDYVTEGSFGYKYCRLMCKDNEVVVNNDRCAPKLKLHDPCDPQISYQCPTNSYCSDKKVCDCFCGFVQLGNEVCAPQPFCPAVQASKNPSFFDVAAKLTSFTVCRISGTSKPSLDSAVETCPKGHYCAAYVPEYGLCCPMPEKPFCFNGAKPGDKCDPKLASACGQSAYCHRYLNPASNDDTSGYVCCPTTPIPL